MSSIGIISCDGIKIILVTIWFSREINREGGESPPQPPLPYEGMECTIMPLAFAGKVYIAQQSLPQMILKSEDLPYGVKCDLSEGEEMF